MSAVAERVVPEAPTSAADARMRTVALREVERKVREHWFELSLDERDGLRHITSETGEHLAVLLRRPRLSQWLRRKFESQFEAAMQELIRAIIAVHDAVLLRAEEEDRASRAAWDAAMALPGFAEKMEIGRREALEGKSRPYVPGGAQSATP